MDEDSSAVFTSLRGGESRSYCNDGWLDANPGTEQCRNLFETSNLKSLSCTSTLRDIHLRSSNVSFFACASFFVTQRPLLILWLLLYQGCNLVSDWTFTSFRDPRWRSGLKRTQSYWRVRRWESSFLRQPASISECFGMQTRPSLGRLTMFMC